MGLNKLQKLLKEIIPKMKEQFSWELGGGIKFIPYPFVLKYNGLAEGKGVFMVNNDKEFDHAWEAVKKLNKRSIKNV